MTFGALEVLALTLIAIVGIKLIVLIINPQFWYSFVEKLYLKPQLISGLALLLAAVVLYFLIVSGVTIVEILAVCLFVVLLMAIGIAKYADTIIGWAKEQDIVFIAKELWLYTLVWILLLAWGVGEIFLS
jgi:hypothetical protein